MIKIITVLIFSMSFLANAQCSEESALAYHKKLNDEYANPDESPLTKSDLKKFKALDFYVVDMQYCVEAKLVRTPNEKPFEMATTTSRKPVYVKYGELHFTLKGEDCKLDVFRNVELAKNEEYNDYLFLPFTDLTSGNGSYGGGRYIDLRVPQGNTITIDFNTAYNPYCAYNHEYSCPLTPQQNDINVAIEAGVKEYKK